VTVRVQAAGATGQAESLSQGDGSGVGLAASQQMVEKLGGRIEVESDGAARSTFRLSLPISPSDWAGGKVEG